MNDSTRSYRLPDEVAPAEVLAAVGRALPVAQPERLETAVRYFDTFDWRLHHDGGELVVEQRETTRHLVWRDHDGGERHRAPVGTAPAFAADVERPALRQALDRVAGIRRLLPLARVQRAVCLLPVIDGRSKIVARLAIVERRAREAGRRRARALPTLVEARPMRGYPRPFAALCALLEGDLALRRHRADELREALDGGPRQPGDYRSKVELTIDPAERADAAVKRVLRLMLATMARNEDGLRRDLDPEFLHDYRVALRRSRSALAQIKGVFPPAVVDRFKPRLAWLGQLTGPTRDLDVMKLDLPRDLAALPATARRALAPLTVYVERAQVSSQRALVAGLDSARYGSLIDAWRRFLERPVPRRPSAPAAALPIAEVAARRLHVLGRRVAKKARRLRPEAESLHDLRIAGKKLRYLIEFFRSLLDAEETAHLLKRLKRVQDRLGTWHDREQQIRFVRRAARRLDGEGLLPVDSALAAGRFLAYLDDAWQDQRRHATEGVDALAAALTGPRLARLTDSRKEPP